MTGCRERWVHLYEFGVGGEFGADDWSALREDERARAACIRDPVRRKRFVVRRAALHAILGEYVDVPVCFSSSHSGDVAAVAVSRDPVGVDVEIETPRRLQERIAERMFTPDERSALEAVHGDARRTLFHRCWVAKEAYAKGLGRGLAMRFDDFCVAAALRSPAGTGTVGADWSVAVTTRADTHLAVAAPGGDWVLEQREVRVG
ncbi:MAG: 4'-phosphopantetheinyl transferase family protein [Solirubrobacterales bacterium]